MANIFIAFGKRRLGLAPFSNFRTIIAQNSKLLRFFEFVYTITERKGDRIVVEKAGEERSVGEESEEEEEEGWMLEDGGAMKKRRSRFGS